MWIFDMDTLRFLAVNSAAVGATAVAEEFLAMSVEQCGLRIAGHVSLAARGLRGGTVAKTAENWLHVRKAGQQVRVEVACRRGVSIAARGARDDH